MKRSFETLNECYIACRVVSLVVLNEFLLNEKTIERMLARTVAQTAPLLPRLARDSRVLERFDGTYNYLLVLYSGFRPS